MKEKKDCKIVQDLLPNYIDKLTNEETNKFIESHLQECEDCKTMYENMKKTLEFGTEKPSKKEINFFKKYKKKLHALEIILLIIFAIIAGDIIRKFVIISELSKKSEEYINYNNYHKVSLYWSAQTESYTKVEAFCLDNKIKNITQEISKDGTRRYTMYGREKTYDSQNLETYMTNVYIEENGEKRAVLNIKNNIMNKPQNIPDAENWWQILIGIIPANVQKVNYNLEECYYITNFSSLLQDVNAGMYVSKDTGLLMGFGYGPQNGGVVSTTQDYFYEFDTVTEEDFVEPDISEYTNVFNSNE